MTDPGDPSQNTAPSHWKYLQQGGANIVLGYNGQPAQAQFDGKLLRARKVNSHRSSAELSAEEEEQLELGFGREVVAPLLGREFVLRTDSYTVDRDWLVELRELLSRNEFAAADRTAGAEVDITASRVQLTDNLTHGHHTLAIEIKPKWGFLPPPPPNQSPSTPTACRFCKHSTLRRASLARADKHAAHQANYCPLDLYSADEARVDRAVQALTAAWRDSQDKQNNLRIFWNGNRVTPDDPEALDQIELALRPAHAHNFPYRNIKTQHLTAHIRTALLGTPVFDRLRHLQSSFAPLTVTQLLPRLPDPLPLQPTLATWCTFIDKYSALPLTADASAEDLLLGQSLSATFKDCSVFLRSTRDPHTGEWQTGVKAIDLDPKPLSKVLKWAELEREVNGNWERDSGAWRAAGWEVRECYE